MGADGISTAMLSKQKVVAGQATMLDLMLDRTDGSAPNITPYLGAFAHVIAVPSDGDSLIHVHPMSGTKPNEGMLHMTLPAKGLYRFWIQFMDNGQVKTVPIVVRAR